MLWTNRYSADEDSQYASSSAPIEDIEVLDAMPMMYGAAAIYANGAFSRYGMVSKYKEFFVTSYINELVTSTLLSVTIAVSSYINILNGSVLVTGFRAALRAIAYYFERGLAVTIDQAEVDTEITERRVRGSYYG